MWQEAASLANGSVPTGAQVEKLVRRLQSEAQPPSNKPSHEAVKKSHGRALPLSKKQKSSEMPMQSAEAAGEAQEQPQTQETAVSAGMEDAEAGELGELTITHESHQNAATDRMMENAEAVATSTKVDGNYESGENPDESTATTMMLTQSLQKVAIEVDRADELAKACRNAIADDVDEDTAARIYDAVRTILEQSLMLQAA